MRVIDVLTSPWAIIPDRLDEITGIYSTHLRGEKIDLTALEARTGDHLERTEQGYEIVDGVAVIPIDGVISKKMNLFSRISGGVSTQLIERDFRTALSDPEVHSIILHADTPGGSVDGTAELAAAIYESRGEKPIYTLVDGLLASAGVWIGSAADKVFISSETAIVGSIGVVTQHVDYSESRKKAGIKITEIYAGKYKRIASDNEPLSDEGQEYIQDHVDYLYSIFVDTVAKHRGTSTADVLTRMADGRSFVGQQAIDAGLVDGVSTLDQLIAMLSDFHSGRIPSLAGSASNDSRSTDTANAETGAAAEAENADSTSELSGSDDAVDNHEEFDMDLKDLKEKHPETAAEAHEEGRTAGMSEGAESERDRIKAVRAQSMPGHEELIEQMAFDGKTTGEQAAVAIVQAENETRATNARSRLDDAADLADVTASVETDDGAGSDDADQTPSEKIKAQWNADAKLRAEFSDEFERFEAYAKNQIRTRVLGGNDK